MHNHNRARGRSRCLLLLACVACVGAHAEEPTPSTAPFPNTPTPTLLIVNGRVWTGVKGAPEAEALAITGARITALGTSDEIRALATKHTTVLDADGRRVTPGITDSHTHMIDTGLHLKRMDLRAARDKEDFVNLVAAVAATLTPGKWLLGGRYSVESWDHPTAPRKEWIDAVTPGTPVYLTRMDGHQALVNSVALKYARIDRHGPPDSAGGEIERNASTGEPTGILKDEAMSLVARLIPSISARERYDALLLATEVANAWGITSIHDMCDAEDLPAFLMARRRNVLTVRIHAYVQSTDFAATWPAVQAMRSTADDFLRIEGFKAFMDGSLGSRTAFMREPYADATPHTRYPRGLRSAEASDLDAFAAQVKWASERKQQLAVHAIGDQAIHELLDIYAALPDCRERRHRVEHTQHLLAEDIARFGRLGVIASMQPFHKADDGRYAEEALGAKRVQTSYAFRSLLDARATVSFGSDTPVVTMNPFSGMAAAIGSRTLHGDVWVPQQSIRRRDALRCYTVTPPYAVFCEKILGTLEVGKFADIAILNTDVLRAPVEQIHLAEAYCTILGGRVVWRQPEGE